jgi:GMP synthase (glutamine-hydrolysing)
MEMPGAKQRAAHFEDRAVHDFAIRSWLSDFLDHWTGHAAADIRAAAGSREHTLAAAAAAPLAAQMPAR